MTATTFCKSTKDGRTEGPERNSELSGPCGAARSHGVKSVLVADDNESSRELLRTVLQQMGHLVQEAANGLEALLRVQQTNPDLIFLDLRMPDLDGFGVLREIRSTAYLGETPIIVLTASGMSGDRERALAAGFTRYLTKPVCLKAVRNEMELAFE